MVVPFTIEYETASGSNAERLCEARPVAGRLGGAAQYIEGFARQLSASHSIDQVYEATVCSR